MKVRRTEKIKVNTFRVGDVIRFKLSDGEKVEMLAVKEENNGMAAKFRIADVLGIKINSVERFKERAGLK